MTVTVTATGARGRTQRGLQLERGFMFQREHQRRNPHLRAGFSSEAPTSAGGASKFWTTRPRRST